MNRNIERVFFTQAFQKTASVLPILMGFVPGQEFRYFGLRSKIIKRLENKAVDLFETNPRKAVRLMCKVQIEAQKLEDDRRDFETSTWLRYGNQFNDAPKKAIVPEIERRQVTEIESFEETELRVKQESAFVRINELRKRKKSD